MSYTANRFSILYFFLIIIASLVTVSLMAQQVPKSFPYQGVARDGDQVVTGQVGLQFLIRKGTLNGQSVFQEQVTTTTNPEGVFAIHIGETDPLSFNQIDWAQGPYFLQVGLDPDGGTNYFDLGTTPILSVPYALYAGSAGTAIDDLDRDPKNELQTLSLNGQQLSLSNEGGSVTLPSAPEYIAGTGISISNNIITNDAPAVDPILTLSGQTLTLNPGGSTVELPTGGESNWTVSGSNIARTTGNVGIGVDALSGHRLAVKRSLVTLNDLNHIMTRIGTNDVNAGRIETFGTNNSLNVRITSSDQNNGRVELYDTTGNARIISQVNASGAGYSEYRGPNGNPNVLLSNLATNVNHGFLGLYNPDGFLRNAMTILNSGEGFVETYGPNGNPNIILSSLENYNNHGFVALLNSFGQLRASMYVNASGNGQIFTSPGNKNFRMEHPELPEKDIWYCSLEGPEAGVYDRGVAALKDGEAFISYSDHFLLVMNPETVTVALTPKEWDTYGLAVTETTDRGFRVRELKNGKGNFSFFWEVKGIIRGHESYRVIRDRSESRPANNKNLMDNENIKSR